MIISKTPYRISFFGGGSDYPSWYLKNGGAVLSATIDKYIYISSRYLPPFFNHKHRIVWSQIETVKELNQIKHKAVREMLRYFKIKEGLEIHYDGDLPARSGMGSSSVFVVGLMNLLNNLLEKKVKKKKLAQESINFEQKILKEAVGSQDQVAAVYGGFNKIIFKSKGGFVVRPLLIKKKRMQKLNKNLLLVYTGIKRTAHDIASGYVDKLRNSKKHHILHSWIYCCVLPRYLATAAQWRFKSFAPSPPEISASPHKAKRRKLKYLPEEEWPTAASAAFERVEFAS